MRARDSRFTELDRLIAEGKGDQPSVIMPESPKLKANLNTLGYFRHHDYAAKMRAGETPNTRPLLRPGFAKNNRPTPWRLLIEEISRSYGFSVEEVLSHSHRQCYTLVRTACYVALYDRGWSLPRIGRIFNRHHTTILASIQKYRSVVAEKAGKVRMPDRGKLIQQALDKISEGVAELRALTGEMG